LSDNIIKRVEKCPKVKKMDLTIIIIMALKLERVLVLPFFMAFFLFVIFSNSSYKINESGKL